MSADNSPMNPVVPPRPDVSYVGVTTRPPVHSRSPPGSVVSHGSDAGPPPVPPRDLSLGQSAASMGTAARSVSGESWDGQGEVLARELEEVRLRAAQMEKTMRWWSDCTANWRDKWSKVRNERNKAREEARSLRAKLETAIKELASLKYQRADELRHSGTPSEGNRNSVASSKSDTDGSEQCIDAQPDCDMPEHGAKDKRKSGRRKEPDSGLARQVTALQAKLEEMANKVQQEHDEKQSLQKSMDSMDYEMTVLKAKYDDLRKSRDEAHAQLNALRQVSNKEHQKLKESQVASQDDSDAESHHTSSADRRLAELRKELERLQAENAAEWAKSEALESEKLALERENKNLNAEIENLTEEVERKSRQASAAVDTDLRSLHQDLAERTKELGDLKHSHTKMKKLLLEKTTDLDHAMRRADQYETEVRKLRGRIEDLKRDLAKAEDEVDQQANLNRRLQRTNDELQTHVENLKVQVDHLHTRLRRPSQPRLSAYDANESTTDGPSDEDMED